MQGCHRRLKGDYLRLFSAQGDYGDFFNEKWLKKQLFLHKGDYWATFFCISRSFDLKNTGKSFRKIISLIREKTNYFPDITRVLTIFAKYLHIYEINHSVKGSYAKNL